MRYLRLIPVLLVGAMLTACDTTQKLYEAQKYDQVIQRLAPDICSGDMNPRHINWVAASYHKANQNDHERIQALKASGQPDVWPEIYQRYCSMKGRNEALSCFSNKVKKGMNYVKLDLDDDILAARNKAENFLVAKANQLLDTGTKADAEEAGKYIEQLRHTNRENANVLSLQKRCLLRSADHVLVTVENEDRRRLLPEFVETILAFDEGEVADHVVTIPKRPQRNGNDVEMVVTVSQIEVSPIRLDEVTFKEINDGKTAVVTDYSQNKAVTVSGTISYYGTYDYHARATVPFEVKSTFKNDYTVVSGDREACSAETLKRIKGCPVPVPTDESMLVDAAKKLNDLIAKELR